MAESTPAASVAAPLPDEASIARAEEFVHERFVLPGEDPAEALAAHSPRRWALDAAVEELDAGMSVPSTAWRRRFSMLLGLERVLSEDEPKLADGTSLNPHQVDALSGTLTALLADAQRGAANGTAAAAAAAPPVVAAGEAEEPAAVDAEDADEAEEPIDADVPEDEEPLDYDPTSEEQEFEEAPEDPNAHKRFWFEHATGAGKTVAAMGFVEASRTGGVLILTHRRNLVDQFNGELKDRGYKDRACKPLMQGEDRANGPVTVETYQWFVRNAGNISSAYTVVICDEAHTALGEKTAAAIREWTGPIFIGMTATGALIARHVTDLFPTQTSRFDLAQAARRGVIAPLRCIRIPPGPGVRTIAKVPLRRGEVDTEFDQEMLAELLDQLPFNLAAANLYKTRFNGMPGVVYAAGVRHAYNLAEAFREEGIKAQAVSGETPKRELAEILADYERGDVDVLINAQLLAEGWNSPRATVCFHLAPTASKRIYQQRVGRVTRRHPGKEAGLVVDFVHPGTKHDDPVVTLHSLLDRDVYRGGAIVVGPVRRGRGRRVRVERRVLPVAGDENRRIDVFERELWRIAVEHLDWNEQIQWAALAGARVAPNGLAPRAGDAALRQERRAQADVPAAGHAAQQEPAAAAQGAAGDRRVARRRGVRPRARRDRRLAARREARGAKALLQSLAEKRIGRRDQADAWIWRVAGYTAELHEEYAVQRWPETKRLLGLLATRAAAGTRATRAGSSTPPQAGPPAVGRAAGRRHAVHAHARGRGGPARRADPHGAQAVVAVARAAAQLPEGPPRALAPAQEEGRARRGARRCRERGGGRGARRARGAARRERDDLDFDDVLDIDPDELDPVEVDELPEDESERDEAQTDEGEEQAEDGDEAVGADHAAPAEDPDATVSPSRRRRQRRRRRRAAAIADEAVEAVAAAAAAASAPAEAAPPAEEDEAPAPKRTRRRKPKADGDVQAAEAAEAAESAPAEEAEAPPKPTRRRTTKKADADAAGAEETPKPARRRTAKKADDADADAEQAPKPARRRKAVTADAEAGAEEKPAPKPRRRTAAAKAADDAPTLEAVAREGDEPKPRTGRTTRPKPASDDPGEQSAA
jgi:superfamily II DNA or RNA helicase